MIELLIPFCVYILKYVKLNVAKIPISIVNDKWWAHRHVMDGEAANGRGLETLLKNVKYTKRTYRTQTKGI